MGICTTGKEFSIKTLVCIQNADIGTLLHYIVAKFLVNIDFLFSPF